jgi:hypothetical protein
MDSGAAGLCFEAQPDNTVNVASAVFDANICYDNGAANWNVLSVGANQVAAFAYNDYFVGNSGSLGGASPFAYQGTNYTTIAAWQAAQEATALNADPKFSGLADDDMSLASGSAMAGAVPVNLGAYNDYLGRAFKTARAPGAYEYYGQ